MENVKSKIKKYESFIIDLLENYQKNQKETHLIVDKEKRHYQILDAGWSDKNTYYCRILMHFHLREDGIICIFENHSSQEVGDILMNQGVPKSDILVSFLPQHARQYAGYAVV